MLAQINDKLLKKVFEFESTQKDDRYLMLTLYARIGKSMVCNLQL
jgi:hypothetical protein